MADPADAAPVPPGGARDRAVGDGRPGMGRVYLECTTTHASRYNTGIQRTVRSIVSAASRLSGPWSCAPIIYNGRYFQTIDRLAVTGAADSAVPGTVSGVESLRYAFHQARSRAISYLPFNSVRERLNSSRLEFVLRRSVYAVQNLRRWATSFRRRGGDRIEFQPGDVIVLLDATWGIDLSRELRRARAAG